MKKVIRRLIEWKIARDQPISSRLARILYSYCQQLEAKVKEGDGIESDNVEKVFQAIKDVGAIDANHNPNEER